jgi:aspartyl aminopeptidase
LAEEGHVATNVPEPTRSMMDLIDASPTPFHAVAEVERRLQERGFQRLAEGDPWSVAPGRRAYTTRNGSSLVAFVAGRAPVAEAGFRVIGAHTDSPNLRLKPRAGYVKEGFRQLGVEVYGGVLLHTWLDRDLSVAGRVCVEGEAEPRLLRIERPLCRVPSLAIHLFREVNEKGLVLNAQDHLPPVLGLDGEGGDFLGDLLASELGVPAGAILASDLMLYDTVRSAVSGLGGEFVHAARLDNLASCHAALESLLAAAERAPQATCAIALWDHEEVGSASAEGAGSPFLGTVLERVAQAGGASGQDLPRALAKSLCVSADMAHGLHPNYADKHEPRHQPRVGGGPVLKVNQSQRYATNAATGSVFLRAARAVEVPVQHFVTRTDLPCGSTIGPITASRLGIPTVDVGNPMLSMHSIREMASSRDQDAMIRVLTEVLAPRGAAA